MIRQSRSRTVIFRLFPREYEALERAAKIAGSPSLSEFMRAIVSEKARVILDENELLHSELEGLKAELSARENAAFEVGGRRGYEEGHLDGRNSA